MAEVNEQTKIAVLQTLVAQLTKDINILVAKVDGLHDSINNHYVKKEDFVVVEKKVEELKYWQIKVVAYATVAAFVLQYLPSVLNQILNTINNK